MIRRHAVIFRAVLMLADAGLAATVAVAVSVARFGRQSFADQLAATVRNPELALVAFAVGWVAVLWAHGLYRQRARWTLRGQALDIAQATLIFALGTLAVLFWLKLPDVSRLLLIVLFPTLAVAALATRIALRLFLRVLRSRGRYTRFMLVVGASPRARAFAELVEAHHELGLVVVGHLQAGTEDDGVPLRRPVLGQLEALEYVLHSRIIDEVAICLPLSASEEIDAIARLCEEEGRIVRIPVAVSERTVSRGLLEEVDGVPVYSLVNGPDRTVALMAKRLLDVAGSAALLVLLSPVFVVLAALVKLDSPGPVHFRQERVGLHGRLFRVVKFRTMRDGAEEELEELLHHNEVNGHAFKMTNDPRTTRVGRWLRRTSLDELPQLWNVLRGQMSLVGPRPPLPGEVANYDVWHRRRLSMKPGMTGLWQIRGRREPEFDRWVETDLEYIDSWSFWLDLKILARTVPAVINGEGR